MQTNVNENIGAYVSLAGIIVSIAQHYNLVLDQNSVVSVLAAFAIIAGWAHQWYTARKATAAGRLAGAIK
jgi:hypothetical protein